jgi:hypothetical protein
MQQYIVEIFNLQFIKIAEIGPCLRGKAQELAEKYKSSGNLLVTITEEELVEVDESYV